MQTSLIDSESTSQYALNRRDQKASPFWTLLVVPLATIALPLAGLPHQIIQQRLFFLPYVAVFICAFLCLAAAAKCAVAGPLSVFSASGALVGFFLNVAISIWFNEETLIALPSIGRSAILPLCYVTVGMGIGSGAKASLPRILLIWGIFVGIYAFYLLRFGMSQGDLDSQTMEMLTGELFARGVTNPITGLFERSTGICSSAFAAHTALFLILVFRSNWERILSFLVFAASLAISIQAETRGVIAVSLLGALLLAMSLSIVNWRVSFLLVAAVALFIMPLALGLVEVPERFTWDYWMTRGLTGRVEIWMSRIISTSLSILGDGVSATMEGGFSSHNQILDTFFAFGILGGLLFLAAVSCLVWHSVCLKLLRDKDRIFLVVAVTMLCIFLHSLVDSHLFSARQTYQLFWFLAGAFLSFKANP